MPRRERERELARRRKRKKERRKLRVKGLLSTVKSPEASVREAERKKPEKVTKETPPEALKEGSSTSEEQP
jgi:hypothetical protein